MMTTRWAMQRCYASLLQKVLISNRNNTAQISVDSLLSSKICRPGRSPLGRLVSTHPPQPSVVDIAVVPPPDTSAPSQQPTDPIPTPRNKTSRNSDLESIVRQGIVYLNQTALAIQQNPRAQKDLFSSPIDDDDDDNNNTIGNDNTSSARQQYEEHRILTTAQMVLEQLVDKNPSHPLVCGATGDPITLLRVSVNETNTYADLYWSLPYSILSQIPDVRQQQILHRVMEKRVVEHHSEFLHRIHANLMKSSYSPRVRLKAADLWEVQEMMQMMEDDD